MTDPPVLHVLEAVRGGTTRHLVDVVRAVSDVVHHVAVPERPIEEPGSGALYDSAAIDAMQAAGAHLHRVGMRRTPTHPANLAGALALHRLASRLRPIVVHGHSSIGGALARATRATTGIPALYTPNGLASDRASHLIERALGPLTARLIAVSASEADDARRWRLVPAERIVVIPNGIDLQSDDQPATDVRGVLGLDPATPLVGCVARLVPQKAPEEFVAVCAAVARQRSEPHFLLIGMGPLQERVDDAVARHGLGARWHQIPHLPDAASALGQLDVFVLPSRFEGGPYTPLEAMRAGTPVVLSDVTGSRDTIEDGVSGYLVAFGNSETMAARVVRLLDDANVRSRMAAAGKERLAAHFDVLAMGARLGHLYREVAAEPKRRSTRRLPHPRVASSTHSPDRSASQYSS
jgi:glycosyltransferase involved in cell wall biosynthesis